MTGPNGTTSPQGDSDRQRVDEAMRGLRYGAGVVERDPELASLVVPEPNPAQAPVEFEAARRYIADAQLAAAIAAYTRAVLNDLSYAEAYDGLGMALFSARRIPECAAALRSGLERDPELPGARVHLAIVEQMQAHYRSAADQWREVLLRDPDHPEGRGRLAVLLYYQGDYAGAWAEFQAAESFGQVVPSQLRDLLAERMPEP